VGKICERGRFLGWSERGKDLWMVRVETEDVVGAEKDKSEIERLGRG